ncbi:MAG TPA: ATP-binding protein [Gemmatimonadales bacterium]|nr:ATP-binding protein [Gemmatimonadales bacterium]
MPGRLDPQTLLDSLDVGVVAIAPDWTITAWTGAAPRVTGLAAEHALGQNFWAVFPTAKGTPLEGLVHDVLHDGTPREYVIPVVAPDVEGVVFRTRISRGPHRHLLMEVWEAGLEVTNPAQAAQISDAFDAERRLLRQLFTSLPIPALVIAVDGQILDVNPEGASLLGVPDPRALRGRRLTDWAPAPERARFSTALRDALRSTQRLRLPIDLAGEPAREVNAVVVSVDQTRGAEKLLFLALDVSREVLLQRKLFNTDRLAQLGALVSGVAHELNNPLAAIAAFAELMRVDAPTTDLRENAEIIHAEAMRAGRVVQTLLDFARQRPHGRQAVDVRDVAERVLALHQSALRRARIQAGLAIPADLPAVVGDPQELQQVVLNAVVNAQQAIEEAGKPGRILISSRRTDGHVMIQIEDTGPGIPADALEQVFDPFFTTKGDQGTGLGLAISLGLVKGMGGRMWVENVEDGGARVCVELPAESARPAPEERAGFRPAERPLALLIVEDESAVRRGISRMAERLGHQVTSAAGLAEAKQRLADPAPYDVLLVDVHLDEAHSGFDLFDALQAEGRGRERRIIFATGDSISQRTRDRLQRSERPVLKKPFNLDELRDVLDRVGGE